MNKRALRIAAISSLPLLLFFMPARHRGDITPGTPPTGNFPATYLATKTNGLSGSTSKIHWSSFLQKPCAVVPGSGGLTRSQVMANMGIDTLVSIDTGLGGNWPITFGGDNGELACLKAAGVGLIAGGNPGNNAATDSVASVLSLATSIGALATIKGYSWQDEPGCSPVAHNVSLTAGEITAINGFDSTRVQIVNHSGNEVFYQSSLSFFCSPAADNVTSLTSPFMLSFDTYAMTDAAAFLTWQMGGVTGWQGSDFLNIPMDGMPLLFYGVMNEVQLSGGLGTKYISAYIEVGTNEDGYSSAPPSQFVGGTHSGTSTLDNNSGYSKFTASWVGLKIAGTNIPSNACIDSVLTATSIKMQDCTSHVAVNGTGTNASVTVTVTGGDDGNSCFLPPINLCLTNGNEFRATPEQVAAEYFGAAIHGANMFNTFPFDICPGVGLVEDYALGDTNCPGAAAVKANLAYVISLSLTDATIWNNTTAGFCSMLIPGGYPTNSPLSVTNTCTNGVITMSTNNNATPGAVMVKNAPSGGGYYVYALPVMRGSATMRLTLTGATGNAIMCYDMRSQYHPATAVAPGTTYPITSNHWDVVMGGSTMDEYESAMKFAVGRAC